MDLTLDLKAAKLLEDALDLMNDKGRYWIQGDYIRALDEKAEDVGYCSLGALRFAQFNNIGNPDLGHRLNEPEKYAVYEKATAKLAAEIGSAYRNSGSTIVEWNDKYLRTWPEIRSTFQRTISKLRGE